MSAKKATKRRKSQDKEDPPQDLFAYVPPKNSKSTAEFEKSPDLTIIGAFIPPPDNWEKVVEKKIGRRGSDTQSKFVDPNSDDEAVVEESEEQKDNKERLSPTPDEVKSALQNSIELNKKIDTLYDKLSEQKTVDDALRSSIETNKKLDSLIGMFSNSIMEKTRTPKLDAVLNDPRTSKLFELNFASSVKQKDPLSTQHFLDQYENNLMNDEDMLLGTAQDTAAFAIHTTKDSHLTDNDDTDITPQLGQSMSQRIKQFRMSAFEDDDILAQAENNLHSPEQQLTPETNMSTLRSMLFDAEVDATTKDLERLMKNANNMEPVVESGVESEPDDDDDGADSDIIEESEPDDDDDGADSDIIEESENDDNNGAATRAIELDSFDGDDDDQVKETKMLPPLAFSKVTDSIPVVPDLVSSLPPSARVGEIKTVPSVGISLPNSSRMDDDIIKEKQDGIAATRSLDLADETESSSSSEYEESEEEISEQSESESEEDYTSSDDATSSYEDESDVKEEDENSEIDENVKTDNIKPIAPIVSTFCVPELENSLPGSEINTSRTDSSCDEDAVFYIPQILQSAPGSKMSTPPRSSETRDVEEKEEEEETQELDSQELDISIPSHCYILPPSESQPNSPDHTSNGESYHEESISMDVESFVPSSFGYILPPATSLPVSPNHSEEELTSMESYEESYSTQQDEIIHNSKKNAYILPPSESLPGSDISDMSSDDEEIVMQLDESVELEADQGELILPPCESMPPSPEPKQEDMDNSIFNTSVVEMSEKFDQNKTMETILPPYESLPPSPESITKKNPIVFEDEEEIGIAGTRKMDGLEWNDEQRKHISVAVAQAVKPQLNVDTRNDLANTLKIEREEEFATVDSEISSTEEESKEECNITDDISSASEEEDNSLFDNALTTMTNNLDTFTKNMDDAINSMTSHMMMTPELQATASVKVEPYVSMNKEEIVVPQMSQTYNQESKYMYQAPVKTSAKPWGEWKAQYADKLVKLSISSPRHITQQPQGTHGQPKENEIRPQYEPNFISRSKSRRTQFQNLLNSF